MKHLGKFLVLGCLVLLLSGCKSKVSKTNFDKITEGMSLADVENILGQPRTFPIKLDTSGWDAMTPHVKAPPHTDVYTWESDNATISISFVAGKAKKRTLRERRQEKNPNLPNPKTRHESSPRVRPEQKNPSHLAF